MLCVCWTLCNNQSPQVSFSHTSVGRFIHGKHWLVHSVDGSEIRRSLIEVGSLSHHLPGSVYPGGTGFRPSTVWCSSVSVVSSMSIWTKNRMCDMWQVLKRLWLKNCAKVKPQNSSKLLLLAPFWAPKLCPNVLKKKLSYSKNVVFFHVFQGIVVHVWEKMT